MREAIVTVGNVHMLGVETAGHGEGEMRERRERGGRRMIEREL